MSQLNIKAFLILDRSQRKFMNREDADSLESQVLVLRSHLQNQMTIRPLTLVPKHLHHLKKSLHRRKRYCPFLCKIWKNNKVCGVVLRRCVENERERWRWKQNAWNCTPLQYCASYTFLTLGTLLCGWILFYIVSASTRWCVLCVNVYYQFLRSLIC